MKQVAIIGSGSWGIALATHLAKNGNTVKVWSYLEEEKEAIQTQRRCIQLPNLHIPESITCSNSFEEVLEGSDIVLHVTPSKVLRSTIRQYKPFLKEQPVVICSKGLENETLTTLSEVAKQELPNQKIGVFSGPSHAEEVCMGVPTAIVMGAEDNAVIADVQEMFMNSKMRVYASNDVKGVELGGALKNIIAFCSGIAAEMNMGDNTFAALITRGLVEISKLGEKMGAKKETFYGLSGLGDLIVTCLSEHSRNRKAGKLVGKGLSLEEVRKEVGMTIESIDNIEAAYKLAKQYGIEMPIVNAVYDVLYNGLKPEEAVTMLMTRDKKFE